MKFFTNCKSLDELKAEYRRLIKIHHPDCGGDAGVMKQVNNDYEARFEQLKKQHNETSDAEHQTTETAAEFIEIIEKLMHINNTGFARFAAIPCPAFVKFSFLRREGEDCREALAAALG